MARPRRRRPPPCACSGSTPGRSPSAGAWSTSAAPACSASRAACCAARASAPIVLVICDTMFGSVSSSSHRPQPGRRSSAPTSIGVPPHEARGAIMVAAGRHLGVIPPGADQAGGRRQRARREGADAAHGRTAARVADALAADGPTRSRRRGSATPTPAAATRCWPRPRPRLGWTRPARELAAMIARLTGRLAPVAGGVDRRRARRRLPRARVAHAFGAAPPRARRSRSASTLICARTRSSCSFLSGTGGPVRRDHGPGIGPPWR
jgi:hypothetical protein